MELTVTDNPARSRFEIYADGELAGFAVYQLDGKQIALIHTETDDQFRGHGVASQLIRSTLDAARERHLAVLPYCPFANEWISEHREYVDLVPASRRAGFGL
jgi:uncharacterized protein